MTAPQEPCREMTPSPDASDLRGRVSSIETKVCKLDLLTGEYDLSCTPEDTGRAAAATGGASVTIMEKRGHAR